MGGPAWWIGAAASGPPSKVRNVEVPKTKMAGTGPQERLEVTEKSHCHNPCRVWGSSVRRTDRLKVWRRPGFVRCHESGALGDRDLEAGCGRGSRGRS